VIRDVLNTYVRQKVKQCITGQCSDGQTDQQLNDVAMVIFDHRNDENAAETDDTDEQNGRRSVQPHLQTQLHVSGSMVVVLGLDEDGEWTRSADLEESRSNESIEHVAP
jgi:hypothetical protein